MDMQIAITGRGGQGVLFLTRLLAECALEMGLPVIASETHGMAMRGGSVISTLKVGSFRGPLIRAGQADFMLVLDEGSLATFGHLLSPEGSVFLNAPASASYPFIDATTLASQIGAPLLSNLVLLGFTLRHQKLFCDYPLAESATARISPERFQAGNLQALQLGYSHPEGKGPR
jgi:indolepyruvate ferredoxin oxidoreductase, beta subunit